VREGGGAADAWRASLVVTLRRVCPSRPCSRNSIGVGLRLRDAPRSLGMTEASYQGNQERRRSQTDSSRIRMKGIRLTTRPSSSKATSIEPVRPIQVRCNSIPPTVITASGFRPKMSSTCAGDIPGLILLQFLSVIRSGGTTSKRHTTPPNSITPMSIAPHSRLRRNMLSPSWLPFSSFATLGC
jgi:hypothetical protein